jgi:hypothetical protein
MIPYLYHMGYHIVPPRGSSTVPANLLRSLETDLADGVQEEGDGAEKFLTALSIDKERETDACELGIRYPTLQLIYAGELNILSRVNIMYYIRNLS